MSEVPQPLLASAVWLSKAWLAHGDKFASRAEQAASSFARLRDGETPEMYLRSAGRPFPEWRTAMRERAINDDGARKDFVEYCANRDAAECVVLNRLAGGDLLGIGARGDLAKVEWIPPLQWHVHSLRPDPHATDVVRGDGTEWFSVRVVESEADSKVIGDDATLPPQSGRPTQEEVNTWLVDHYSKAHGAGRPPPKRDAEAFPACRDAIGATELQMKTGMRNVPNEFKRQRGHRDREPDRANRANRTPAER
jgi:hypothetical protein